MNFGSDNTGPAHPRVMDALMRANEGYALPYGTDDLTRAVTEQLRAVFEAPQAEVFLVALGTAANSLALSALVQPWQAIYCSRLAHIHTDECGAPEFYSGGAKLVMVPETDGKMHSADLDAAIAEGLDRGLHYNQPGAVSITQVTECGTVHSLNELGALADVAKTHRLPVHLDGARFANALVALGCSPAEMTWKAGIDVVSFGATKNGLLGAEAVIFFNPDHSRDFEFRRKRAAQLFSKHRYLAAQMAAYLDGDLWLDMARAANASAARLADGIRALPNARLHHPVDANILFASLPRAAHRRAVAAGAQYFLTLEDLEGGDDTDVIPARLVCDWSIRNEAIDQFLDLLRD